MSRARLRNLQGSEDSDQQAEDSSQQASLRMAFGRRLRTLRHHRLMSQRALATTSNVSMNTIGSIERGLRFPSPEVLESLASALDVEVKEMFEINDHAAPVTLEGSARELCRVVNDELLPRVEQLTALANRLIAEVAREQASKPDSHRSADRQAAISAA